jgi:cell division septation protein DedD
MSMNNKQRWMGGVVLLGGGVLLAALLLKGKEEIHKNEIPQPVEAVQQNKTEPEVVQLQPLTVDVETEKRLLEEQRRAREKAVAEQEARAAEYLRTQQEAEAEAARRAAEEYAAMNARKNSAQQSSDNIPPELIEDEADKKKRLAEEQRLVEQKKAAEQKAKDSQKSAEDKRKAEAEKLAADKKAAENKAAEEKRKTDEAKKKAEADKKVAEERKATEEKKRKAAEEEKKKTEAEKARDLLENGDRQWMVQVALAANEANADALSAKLRAKGYKVTKSPTSKGVRIMVGPSKDRETADAMRKKINADSSLNMKSAWVIDWVPLDRR